MPLGLNLIAYEPLSEQGLYSRDFIDDITGNHSGYTHTISAVGGFDTATFTLRGDLDYLNDWFDDGIMRRVVLYNPEAIPVWEGFVSRLRFTVGTLQKTKSVDTMFNRVYLRYSPLDFSVFPPIADPPVNIVVDDATSQSKYGVKSVVISGGERVDATAYEWASTTLKETKDVQIGESVNTRRTDTAFIEVECKGYYHTLKWIPYINNTTGSIQSHQVIQEVLDYFNDINQGWISQNFGWMDYNFRTEQRGYDSLPSCWDVINNIIKEGGKGGERWVGGLYQNRKMIYKAAEDAARLYSDYFELYRSLRDTNQFIYDFANGTEVKPWDMQPDRMLRTIDTTNESLMYIEQVVYTEPYQLTLIGGDDQRLSVFLAQRGLPGG